MWIYQSKPINSIEELPHHEALLGFCYKITNLKTGAIYIGKKNFYSVRKKAFTKKELALVTDKRLKKHKHVTKQSDWLTYWGSSTLLLEDMKVLGQQWFQKEILELACSLKQISYIELKHMFKNDVLENESYNGNILGRYYTRDLEQKCF